MTPMVKTFGFRFRWPSLGRPRSPRGPKRLLLCACTVLPVILGLSGGTAGATGFPCRILGLCGEPARATTSPCRILDREKWLWHSWFEDFIPPFFEDQNPKIPQASFRTCWECGLWTNQAWPPSWNPPALQAPITFQKAECYRAVGMQEAALDAYRNILQEDVEGGRAPACIEAIIEMLFNSGNLEAALFFYDRLDPARKPLTPPGSLYLLGQSCYLNHSDAQALSFLARVPPEAEVYPLARYTMAQIAFRNDEAEQALELIRSLADPENGASGSEVIRDLARLTLARILFQQGKYEEASSAFRDIHGSRFFLPEALLGMGWCQEAMDRPAGAIAYFEAAEEAASRDLLVQNKARLEQARLYAESGIHEEAFQILKKTQDQIREYIAFLNQNAGDPTWLANRARTLWPPSDANGTLPPPEVLPVPPGAPDHPAEDGVFQDEADTVLEKHSCLSPRMQRLQGIRDALTQVRSLLDRPEDPEEATPTKRGISTLPYPPLDTRVSLLVPYTNRLLDVSLALLDTEYRLNNLTGSLNLSSRQERKGFCEEALRFYTQTFRELIGFSLPDQRGAYDALSRLLTVVRYLPEPLEAREQIVRKLISTQEELRDAESNLDAWSRSLEDAGSGEFPSPRPLLLRLWMIYVRSLVQFRSWEDRSPAAFLLQEITPSKPAAPAPPAPDGRRNVLADRITQTGERLRVCYQKEARLFFEDRLASFERLLTDSELYYAEALLKQQKSLLQELQSLPPEEEPSPSPAEGEDNEVTGDSEREPPPVPLGDGD
jgi:tetratricopeptide (TPR) repeat protein